MKLVLFLSMAAFAAGTLGAGFPLGGGGQGFGNQGGIQGTGSSFTGGQFTGGGSISTGGAQFQTGSGNQNSGGFQGNGGNQSHSGFQNGGGATGGGRPASEPSAPPHSSGGSRNGAFQTVPQVLPPTRIINPPAPVIPRVVPPGPPSAVGTTGSGFNNRNGIFGTAPTNNVVRDRSRPVLDPRVIASSTGVTADPTQVRSRTTTTATGVGAMPAVRQHLLNHGQSLQTWTANRDLAFNQLHQQNAAQIEAFQRNRNTQWSQLQGHGGELVRMARDRGADWQNYRRDLWHYRIDRAHEIRDQLRNGCDDLFTFDWWGRHRGRNFFLGNNSPWWWWNPCSWNAASAFCGYGWGGPIYYDYGANVLVGDDVYVDGQDSGPSAAYAQQAMALANPPVTEEDPAPPQPGEPATDWQPFGVFALTQEQGGSAVMFFELAVNKDGRISGAFTNILTDDAQMVRGSIDRTTQKVAWHVGDKADTVYETGVANLTLDVAPVLIHFGTQTTQTWLLVRMSSPDQSTTPATPAPVP